MTTAEQAIGEAPAFIARDTYRGRWSVLRNTDTVKAASFTAAEIAALAPTGVIWKSFGHPFPGREGFGRERYVATAEGDLHIYNSDGALSIIYPAARVIRLLTT
jgi:hypothetical protein